MWCGCSFIQFYGTCLMSEVIAVFVYITLGYTVVTLYIESYLILLLYSLKQGYDASAHLLLLCYSWFIYTVGFGEYHDSSNVYRD